MRKVIAAINMTLDGFCDHTEMTADDEIYQHYNELLSETGILIYGRGNYQLMESFWPTIVEKPTGNKEIDRFAVLLGDIPKIVFSRTLESLNPSTIGWKNSSLKKEIIKEEILELKQELGKPIFVGSSSLIVTFMKLDLIDEFQICIQPIILGKGTPLFQNLDDRVDLKLIKSKTFTCGAVTHYYETVRKCNSLITF